MASPRLHPRRTSNLRSTPTLLTTNLDQPGNLYLKKFATFHSPSSPSQEDDPILSISSLPKRSSTCLKELDNNAVASSSDRIAQVIGAVDRSFSDLSTFASRDQKKKVIEATPVPSFMVDHVIKEESDRMDLDYSRPSSPHPIDVRKHHASDSGIGSTISSVSLDGMDLKLAPSRDQVRLSSKEALVQTSINGAGAAPLNASNNATQHVLSEYACRQIQRHIIVPIIREERLKSFHALVNGLPYRIARKEITCLRDLEKILLWLAPKWSASKASFLLFCETTIQCLHTTVDYLNERDQCRPTDRPYTNGYFLDLVEQVRQYAAHLAATRSRMSSDERVDLVGGLSRTGRPAELVRTKNGRSISLRTGEEVSEEYKKGIKRPSEEVEEESLERSMARRRKSAPAKVAQKCSECDKLFKRPCDLTKHEKTHSRPWKCGEKTCKYHEYGWPTEKERDRHANDKHSAAPNMYKCKFVPCPYETKRESNCKQHMEKAHGWTYVRSKNNRGNGVKRPQVNGKTPPTPIESTPESDIFAAPTPEFLENGSCYDTPSTQVRTASFSGSVEGGINFPNANMAAFSETFGPANDFAWPDANDDSFLGTEFSNTLDQSWNSAMANPDVVPSTFNNIADEDQSMFGPDFDWSNMDSDFAAMNVQLATPAVSVHHGDFRQEPKFHAPSLSPGAHADAMLYSPYSMNSNEIGDETFAEDYSQNLVCNKPLSDFALFDGNTVPGMNNSSKCAMFQDLASFNGNYSMGDMVSMEE